MKNLFFKFLYLTFICLITVSIEIVPMLIKSKKISSYDFLSSLLIGIIIWLGLLLSGKLKAKKNKL